MRKQEGGRGCQAAISFMAQDVNEKYKSQKHRPTEQPDGLAVGKAARCGLKGPDIESLCGREFLHPSRPDPAYYTMGTGFLCRGKAAGAWR